MRRRVFGFLSAALFGASCSGLDTAAPPSRPMIRLLSPSDGAKVPFDMPFGITASAEAPSGGTLVSAELVVSGAISETQSLPLSGNQGNVDLQLVVPSNGRLGPDRVPLELQIIAVARVGVDEVVSGPASIMLAVVDKTPPTLDVILPPGIPAPPAFDRAYPPGMSFSVSVRAHDPVGGITKIVIVAPPFAGGMREAPFPPSHDATFSVEIAPPQNVDLAIMVHAEDAAAEPNSVDQVVSVRVGNGGEDRLPPAIMFLAPDHAECASTVEVTAVATDDSSGVFALSLRAAGIDASVMGPDPKHPLVLSISSTIAVGPDRPIGTTIEYEARAVDVVGNQAAPEPLVLTVKDTIAPILQSATSTQSAIAPGGAWPARVRGSDRCGLLGARATFVDERGVRARTLALLGTRMADAPVTFLVPEALCTLSAITASVALVDMAELVSSTVAFRLTAKDVVPPSVMIASLQAGGIVPGDALAAEVNASDGQTPIKSATITLGILGLSFPAPAPMHLHPPARVCADIQDLGVPVALPVPLAVRFSQPAASIRIDALVEDAARNRTSTSLDVPIVDRTPPDLSIVSPANGVSVAAGATIPVRIRASDLNHNVDFVALTVSGPGSIGTVGTRSATIAVGVMTATVSFSLLVDPAAPLGAAIHLSARAQDTSIPVNAKRAAIDLASGG
jgi:hypothetical protein